MKTTYHVSVWSRAMRDAEEDVMRATATPIGGRLTGEELLDFVDRTRKMQDAAIARWMVAKAEMEDAMENEGIPSLHAGAE